MGTMYDPSGQPFETLFVSGVEWEEGKMEYDLIPEGDEYLVDVRFEPSAAREAFKREVSAHTRQMVRAMSSKERERFGLSERP